MAKKVIKKTAKKTVKPKEPVIKVYKNGVTADYDNNKRHIRLKEQETGKYQLGINFPTDPKAKMLPSVYEETVKGRRTIYMGISQISLEFLHATLSAWLGKDDKSMVFTHSNPSVPKEFEGEKYKTFQIVYRIEGDKPKAKKPAPKKRK